MPPASMRSGQYDRPVRSSLKRSACDRCRGHKLRCLRDIGNVHTCIRCARANVQCSTGPPKPLGRPNRREPSTELELVTSALTSGPVFATDFPETRRGSSSDDLVSAATLFSAVTVPAIAAMDHDGGQGTAFPNWTFPSDGPDALDSLFGEEGKHSAINFLDGSTVLSDVHDVHDSSPYPFRDDHDMDDRNIAPPTLQPSLMHHHPFNLQQQDMADAGIRFCQLNLALSQQLQYLHSKSWDDMLHCLVPSDNVANVNELSPALAKANPLGDALCSTSEFLTLLQQCNFPVDPSLASASSAASGALSTADSVPASGCTNTGTHSRSDSLSSAGTITAPLPSPLSSSSSSIFSVPSASSSTLSISSAASNTSSTAPSLPTSLFCSLFCTSSSSPSSSPPSASCSPVRTSPLPSLSISTTLSLLSCYLHLVAIYDALFGYVVTFLSRLPAGSVSTLQTVPGLQLAGFPVHHGGLQIKILVQVMQHQIEMVERALGLPPEYSVSAGSGSSQRQAGKAHTMHHEGAGLLESKEVRTLLGVIMSSDGMGVAGGHATIASIRENIKKVQQFL